MKILKIVGFVVAVAVVVIALAAPIGPLPGFLIGGTPAEVPASWGDTRPIHEIKLKVGSSTFARVVIIWVVQVDGDLFVVGADNSGWTQAIGNGGNVKMRMGDHTYDMQANRVNDGWERVLEAYVAKYEPDYPDIVAGFPSPEEAAGTTAVFRLAP